MTAAPVSLNSLKAEEGWREVLAAEFSQTYMKELSTFLTDELAKGKIIYPPGKEIFSAFNSTPFSQVKVVIIGQDPYHGPGQAHGLSFSVRPGVRPPPSLVNIFKELKNDLGFDPPGHGLLQSWAEQGVLLLNAVLTVEEGRAGSHHGRGWERFTDSVIQHLNQEREHLVFILWGSPAQKKGAAIDPKKHLILKSTHPSPLSAHRGFFGNHHFSKANQYLAEHGVAPIDWKLPPLH